MSFDPNAGSAISLDVAVAWTANWRSVRSGTTDAVYLNKSIIQAILDQPGCVGVRTYNAINSDNIQTIIMVGVDSLGNDMINGIIADYGSVCPPNCPPSVSPLGTTPTT